MPNIITPGDVNPQHRYAIVVARWNLTLTSKLLSGAVEELTKAGIAESQIDVAWVPGSWELPLVAQQMAKTKKYVAVICLGIVIRGETTHDQHINRGVSLAFSKISLETGLPILFGVLTCETMEQAIHRSGGNVGNKGAECAQAALEMVGLLETIKA